MAKLRLSRHHRNALRDLAKRLISCPFEQATVNGSYVNAARLVRKMVEAILPPADMKVLQKYEQAGVDDCIRMTLSAGGFTAFRFSEGTGPLNIGCRVFLADEATTAAVSANAAAAEVLKQALEAKRRDYYSLIEVSRYFEDVIEVWPEAEQLDGRFQPNALVTLTSDVVSRIRQDVASRQAA